MNINEAIDIRNVLKKDSASKGFLFFSDYHHQQNPLGRILATAREWGPTYIDAIINGGDFIGGVTSSSDTTYGGQYKTALDGLVGNDPLGIDVLNTMGNHDCWKDAFHNWMTQAEAETRYGSWPAAYASSFGSSAPVQPHAGSVYYHKDYGSVRVIVLNAVHAAASQTKLDGAAYTGDIYWDSTQKTWLQNVLADARTNNKHVLLVNHYMPDKTVMYESTTTTIKQFKKDNEGNPWNSLWGRAPGNLFTEGWMPTEVLGVVKSFMDAGGILIGWLGGHTHNDMLWGVKPSLEATYGRQMLFTTGTAGLDGDLDGVGTTHDLYNYVVVHPTNRTMTVVRLGLGWDTLGRERRIFVWDYENKVFLRYK